MLAAIQKVIDRVEGSYALGIICADCPEKIFAVRKDSPLIVGVGRGENFIASDIPAILSLSLIHIFTGCELYVTLEPCPMCTGALINAHIDTVVYGAEDERAGCCGTAADLFTLPYSHRPEVYRGFLEEEAKALLREFFNGLRH